MNIKEAQLDMGKELVEKIIQNQAPWQKSWNANTETPLPYNPTTNQAYSGTNIFMLDKKEFKDPRWLTYKQAKQNGWFVKKGEKGTHIMRFVQKYKENEQEPGKQTLQYEGIKAYVVFNAAQIEGIEPYARPSPEEQIKQTEELIKSTGIKFVEMPLDTKSPDTKIKGGEEYALYFNKDDTIHVPSIKHFENKHDYYNSVFAGLASATSHPTRLQRETVPKDPEEKMKEHLRTQIATYLLSRQMQISYTPKQYETNSEKWNAALQQNPLHILRGCSEASTINRWITQPEKRKEIEHSAQEKARGREKTEEKKEVLMESR